jgi:hypothetical protein
MYFEKKCEMKLSVEDVLSEMSKDEKKEMYEALKVEMEGKPALEFADMMPSEQKRFLCDALGVPSYYENECLRQKLETIINAI